MRRHLLARAAFIAAAFVAFASYAANAEETEDVLADRIASAVVRELPLPDVPGALEERAAYRIQADWTEAVYGRGNVGYKAGLTSPGAQQRFGIDFPVLGVLPASARLDPGAEIADRPGLMLEIEIGFVVASATNAAASAAVVGRDDVPAVMMAVIEIPRLSYAAPERLDLADVVASNVSAYRFITGGTVPFDPAVGDTVVTLTRNGEVVNRGVGRDALGDPVEAYRWMVRKIASVGYPLVPGMVMLTGALGRVVEAEPGRYVASFGELGEVAFTIR